VTGDTGRQGDWRADAVSGLTIGVLGGTGEQGRGLAYRFARSGLDVVVGSRSVARAEKVAAALGHRVRGAANEKCAAAADILVVAVPWDGHASLLRSLAEVIGDRVVVDCVNPLAFDGKGAYALPVDEGSACEQAQALLPAARVVGAFHHLSAVLLLDQGVDSVDADVLVLGDDRDATDLVQALAARLPGGRGVFAGRLRNAHQVEALTANLISVNRRYKVHAGIRVTDV
jgi:8-hydroxy-5-deazaflavin:NADPH oxidoreductase